MRTAIDTSNEYLFRFFLLTVGYGLLAHVFFNVVMPGSPGFVVWPPLALGVAALILYGLDLWPAILLGTFLVRILHGYEPPVAAIFGIAHTMEALVGAYLLTRRFDFHPLFYRMNDSLSFILASIAASLTSATLGVTALAAVGYFSGHLLITISAWWLGHAVTLLTFSPFLIRWGYRPIFHKTRAEILESMLLFSVLVAMTVLLFWTPYHRIGSVSLLYILVIPLIWAAMRTGPRGTTLALFLTGTIAIGGSLLGTHFPVESVDEDSFLLVQVLLGTLNIVFLLFASTVEERKEAVRELKQHVDKLEDALVKIRSEDQAKTDFLATLAHELRNPLAPVVSSIELMKANGLSDENAPQVEVIHTHIMTMVRLLDDLLDVSRISRRKFKLNKEPVTLQSAALRSIETVQPLMAGRQHTVHVSMPPREIWLTADPVRLEQIFVNLLSNAAKYTEPGGRIEFVGETREKYAVVRIRDSGIGIPGPMLDKIFEPFMQINPPTAAGSGLGIGLSLTKKLVELHHGRIVAHSKGLGLGSEFVVELPIPASVQLPLGAGAPAAALERSAPGRLIRLPSARPARRILVVDDNRAAAQGLGMLLRTRGHAVTLAYDGPQALEEAQKTKPEIAILDIGLPGMDGYELGRTLRERFGSAITLIALTGYGQEEDKQKALKAGFARHLIKPVGIAEVDTALAELGKND